MGKLQSNKVGKLLAAKNSRPRKPRAASRAASKTRQAGAAPTQPDATAPTVEEIAEREAVVRAFFSPVAAAAARAAFRARQQPGQGDAK